MSFRQVRSCHQGIIKYSILNPSTPTEALNPQSQNLRALNREALDSKPKAHTSPKPSTSRTVKTSRTRRFSKPTQLQARKPSPEGPTPPKTPEPEAKPYSLNPKPSTLNSNQTPKPPRPQSPKTPSFAQSRISGARKWPEPGGLG